MRFFQIHRKYCHFVGVVHRYFTNRIITRVLSRKLHVSKHGRPPVLTRITDTYNSLKYTTKRVRNTGEENIAPAFFNWSFLRFKQLKEPYDRLKKMYLTGKKSRFAESRVSFITFLFFTSVGDPPRRTCFEDVYDSLISRTSS